MSAASRTAPASSDEDGAEYSPSSPEAEPSREPRARRSGSPSLASSRNDQSASGPDEREPTDLRPVDRAERQSYMRILQMLDYRQHLNLSAHLYSAFLLSKRVHKASPGRRKHRRVPHERWTTWPLENAPAPPQIYDTVSDRVPGLVSAADIARIRAQATEVFPIPPDPNEDPALALLRACEAVLQKTVYQRIQSDPRIDAEPALDPDPDLGFLAPLLVNTVDKYVRPIVPPAVVKMRRPITWDQLGISGPAHERLVRLFDRETVYIDDDNDDDEGDEDGDEDGDGVSDTENGTYGDVNGGDANGDKL